MALLDWDPVERDVPQTDQLLVTGVWAGGDTWTLTAPGGQTLTVTVGSSVAVADVAAAMVAAFNAPDSESGLVNDETRNAGGREIREFRELTAEQSGASVLITHNWPGWEFTLSSGSSTAGTGAVTHTTDGTGLSVLATGLNHADAAQNWLSNGSRGTLPADDDTIRFLKDAPSMLFGLDYFRDNSIELHLIRSGNFREDIGLRNEINQNGYPEYRDRHLEMLCDGTLPKNVSITEPSNPQTDLRGCTLLDADGQTMGSLLVTHLAKPSEGGKPNFELKGGTWTTIDIRQGHAVLDPEQDEPTNALQVAAMSVGKPGGSLDDVLVRVGDVDSASAARNVIQYSGKVDWKGLLRNSDTIYYYPKVYGGVFTYLGGGTAGAYNADVRSGGKLVYLCGGTCTGQITVGTRGILDLGETAEAPSFSNDIDCYGGSTVRGFNGQGIDYVQCTASDVNLIPSTV